MLDCAVKPMATARSKMRFIIIISGLSFKWRSFFPLKLGRPTALSELIDQLQHARAIECKLQPHLAKPKPRLVVNSFYSSHLPPFNEHVATYEVSKKFARSSFQTQEISLIQTS
jgi:hypothetical protein